MLLLLPPPPPPPPLSPVALRSALAENVDRNRK
jgi:hypothetical protein